MDVNGILDVYEDIWREAALSSRPQGFGTIYAKQPRETLDLSVNTCAALIGQDAISSLAWFNCQDTWTCPLCSTIFQGLWQAMVHTNNEHEWPWLDFANKFRMLWYDGLDAKPDL